MRLTSENVKTLADLTLYSPDVADPAVARCVPGISKQYVFNAEHLMEHKELVQKLLEELPWGFFIKARVPEAVRHLANNGDSFLISNQAKNGSTWGTNKDAEMLLCMGMALRLVKYTTPRRRWEDLEGGIPKLVISPKEAFIEFYDGQRMWTPLPDFMGGVPDPEDPNINMRTPA